MTRTVTLPYVVVMSLDRHSLRSLAYQAEIDSRSIVSRGRRYRWASAGARQPPAPTPPSPPKSCNLSPGARPP